MSNVTVTGGGSGVAASVQVTTAATAAIAQSALSSIGSLLSSGFSQANINAGVSTGGSIVGLLGGASSGSYGTLTALNLPNTVQSLVINNTDTTNAGNSRFIGSETVLSGTGNLSFTDNGSSTTIVTGGGNNTISFSAYSSNGSFTGDGNNVISVNSASGSNSVYGTGASADTIVGGTSNGSFAYTSAAGARAFINPRAANVTVFGAGGAGSTTVFGGVTNTATGTLTVTNGTGLFQGGTAGNNLLGSSTVGGTTLMGGGSGDLLQSHGVGDFLIGGAGASTLDGSYSAGGVTLSGAAGGASLIYASQTRGDTVMLSTSTVQGIGYVGEFIDLHTGPNSLLRSLNAGVASTIVGGTTAGPQFASIGDFVSGTDKLLLTTSVSGTATIATGSLTGAGGQQLAYSQVTTTNGSNFIFYNTTLTNTDIVTR